MKYADVNNSERRSHSQYGEDLVIIRVMWLLGRKPKDVYYIDVGLDYPMYSSNTYLFYEQGARGILIEPNPQNHAVIQKFRPYDKLLKIGAGNKKETKEFHVADISGVSTFDEGCRKFLEGHVGVKESHMCPIERLDTIIKNNGNKVPDLVSIDVEHYEIPVLEGLGDIRPLCLCIETESIAKDKMGKKRYGLIERVKAMGYTVLADTYGNTVFLRTPAYNRIIEQ